MSDYTRTKYAAPGIVAIMELDMDYPLSDVAYDWLNLPSDSRKYDNQLTEFLDSRPDCASSGTGDCESPTGYIQLFTFHRTDHYDDWRDNNASLAVVITTNNDGFVRMQGHGTVSQMRTLYDELNSLYHNWADSND